MTTTKTVLFASLIALAFIPAIGTSFADPCDGLDKQGEIDKLQQAQADASQALEDARVANATGDVSGGYDAQINAAKASRAAHAAYMNLQNCFDLDAEQLENARLTADAATNASLEANALALQTQNGTQVWEIWILVVIIIIIVGNTIIVIRIWRRLPR